MAIKSKTAACMLFPNRNASPKVTKSCPWPCPWPCPWSWPWPPDPLGQIKSPGHEPLKHRESRASARYLCEARAQGCEAQDWKKIACRNKRRANLTKFFAENARKLFGTCILVGKTLYITQIGQTQRLEEQSIKNEIFCGQPRSGKSSYPAAVETTHIECKLLGLRIVWPRLDKNCSRYWENKMMKLLQSQTKHRYQGFANAYLWLIHVSKLCESLVGVGKVCRIQYMIPEQIWKKKTKTNSK